MSNFEQIGINGVDYDLADAYLREHAALKDGYYEGMSVGNADQLMSAMFLTEREPYLFRTTGGALEVGNREYLELNGGSVAWNQLVTFNAGTSDNNGITYTQNSDGSVNVSGTATASSYLNVGTTLHGINGHVILVLGCPAGGSSLTYYLRDGYVSGKYDVGSGLILKKTVDNLIPQIVVTNGTAISDTLVFKPQLYDLTQMFGSTIADYIYTLEQNTAGAGVAWFRKLFPADYYAYDAGSLKHVNASALKTTGFNQWDEEFEEGTFDQTTGEKTSSTSLNRSKNPIRVLPDTVYCRQKTGTSQSMRIFFYTEDMTLIRSDVSSANTITFTTPSNCHYLNIAFQKTITDICINLHWDGERDGEYEEYVSHSYPLDSDLVLRGIPKLDSSNNLYFDGDTYQSDGTVTRNTILRAYQSGDESLAYAITDGTNTVVYSANASTESADAFAEPMICDNWGTEAFTVTAQDGVEIPVGHTTKYPPDLKAKLEVAPESPDADGLYLMKRENGQNSYIEYISPLPSDPASDGTYVLKAVKSGSTVTLSWEEETA